MDPKLKKIFIDPKMIDDSQDGWGAKPYVIEQLKAAIEEGGRYEVIIGPVTGVDPNREPVALIQGKVTSREDSEVGQFTDIATCQGGLAGFAAGASAIESDQGVTVSPRGLLCRSGNDTKAALVSAGVGMAMSMISGEEQAVDPVDSVVRIYKYRNLSLYAQIDLTLTYWGEERKTVALRSDGTSYSKHLSDKAINVHSAYSPEMLGALIAPVFPLMIRPLALVEASNPGDPTGQWATRVTRNADSVPREERVEIAKKMVKRALRPFVETVTPYPAQVRAEVAGSGEVKDLLLKGDWQKARGILEAKDKKDASDLYNLGLTYEAGASSEGDYIEARRLYLEALAQDESNRIYAQGVGRMERALNEAKLLKKQGAKG